VLCPSPSVLRGGGGGGGRGEAVWGEECERVIAFTVLGGAGAGTFIG
jgi:hypothetical protein